MTRISDKERRSYLKDEYHILQNQYEDYDRRSLTIKGWISFASVAAIAIGLDKDKKILLIVTIIAACIWYLEARWKTFQYASRDRIRLIEAYFRSDRDVLEKKPEPFQIYHWWFKSHTEDQAIYPYEKKFRPRSLMQRILAAMFLDFVFLPYLPIIVICLFLYRWPNVLN